MLADPAGNPYNDKVPDRGRILVNHDGSTDRQVPLPSSLFTIGDIGAGAWQRWHSACQRVGLSASAWLFQAELILKLGSARRGPLGGLENKSKQVEDDVIHSEAGAVG